MRQCEVPKCADRPRSPHLCLEHMVQWHDSGECRESQRTKDFAGTYQRWLKRVVNGTPKTGSG